MPTPAQRWAPQRRVRLLEDISAPGEGILGDGWAYEGGRAFTWTTNIAHEQFPPLAFGNAVTGSTYRFLIQVTTLDGTTPGLRVRTGWQGAAPDEFVITTVGTYDFVQKCGTDNNEARIIVDDNLDTTAVTIKNLYIQLVESTPK